MAWDHRSVNEQDSGQGGCSLKVSAELFLGTFRADPRSDPPSSPLLEGLTRNPTPPTLFLPNLREKRSGWLFTGNGRRRVEVVTGVGGLADRSNDSMSDILSEALEVVLMTPHGDPRGWIPAVDELDVVRHRDLT
jgi:hypothetical protein